MLTGRDSALIRDAISDETSNVDWAKLLLDEETDDMVIIASREKIAHQMLKLIHENKMLEAHNNGYSRGVLKKIKKKGSSMTPLRPTQHTVTSMS